MSFNINTRVKAEQALRRRDNSNPLPLGTELHPATVIAENGDGWDVQTIDAGGRAGRSFSRVYPHPSDATITVDQDIWLWVPGDGEAPVIMVSGSGATCQSSILIMGTLDV